MIRKSLLILSIIVLSLSTEAKSLQLTEGSINFLSEKCTMLVNINWDNAVVNGKNININEYYKSKGKKESANWEQVKDYSNVMLSRHFNEYLPDSTRAVSTYNADESHQYNMIVKVSKVDIGTEHGMTLGVAKKSGGLRIYGTIVFTNSSDNSCVATIDIKNIKGSVMPSINGKVWMVCRYLSEEIIKQIK